MPPPNENRLTIARIRREARPGRGASSVDASAAGDPSVVGDWGDLPELLERRRKQDE